ncbi:MAG: hypothetical protein GJ680_01500 [Alteromonadaceae bacterium]|nr:hypothetical protein [Alteromonadaceae bacterium]
MNKSYDDIQRYLSELKSALQGQPAGMVQDALYDVENHLLEALANEDNADIAALINEFGTPQELAAQYIQLEQDSLRFLNGVPS